MKEYMRELRELVGSRPMIMCGASVILFNAANEVLMLRRSDNGGWCFPGGAVELGESVRQTALRELHEETGLELSEADLELFDVFSGPELYYKYPHGDEVHNVDTVFLARRYAGELRINEESSAARFFAPSAIPDAISPPVIPVVRALKERYGKAERSVTAVGGRGPSGQADLGPSAAAGREAKR